MDKIVKSLLEINAVKFNTEKLYTWTSGIKSPIYTDNRVIMSHIKQRKIIYESLAKLIIQKFNCVTCLVGTAVAGIAPCSFAAQSLNLPMVFVRSSAKKHGTQKQIEGEVEKNAKVVIIEDLISTGKSLKTVIDVLRSQNIEIIGVVSIFTYNLDKATKMFLEYKLEYFSLITINYLLDYCYLNKKLNNNQINEIHNFLEGLNEK